MSGVSGYMLLIVLSSCIGGLLFGYDSAVISGVLVLIKDDLGHDLSTVEKEVVTSITSLGALIGSVAAGILADRIGRRPIIVYSSIAFILSAFLMSFSYTVLWFVSGRLFVGLAVGAASTTVPVYIAELSPASHRGRLVALNSISTTGGQALAYLTAVVFATVSHGWRYIIGLSIIPPIFFLMVSRGFPESPRYLLHCGKVEEAEDGLSNLYPGLAIEEVREMLNQQACDVKEGQDAFNFNSLFLVPSNRRAILVACGLMAAQQTCGINSFMYYSATIFAMVGFKNPVAVSLIVSFTNFLFTWPAVLYIDSLGRRKMLLGTMWILVLSLIATAWTFGSNGVALVCSTVIYIAAYAAALGNVPWQSTEFLPLNVRSLGSMLISSTNWLCNALVSMSFLTMLDVLSAKGTFLCYAAITAFAYAGVYLYYPEVAGMSLEDISRVFVDDTTVPRTEYTQLIS
ncbi:hypothetical protein TRICI_004336 [Trichomonascus ciferrii]|uniref:Major facilitator superfamily (MFS) profile domain-containing protein n=1 Tax=Trichomonascus ciferrii TaxID=44093 RepID=A0A642V2N1_9ASCO|nr:hypothetical protein TRICI_004336 [Trichomonascus ciferrii]